MAYFPVVGASLGALIGLSWACRATAAPAATRSGPRGRNGRLMTGGLHLDGLADTADGLCAHVPAKSRLEIMAEPQVGTFAVVALGACSSPERLRSRPSSRHPLCSLPSTALRARSWSLAAGLCHTFGEEGLATAFLPAPGSPDNALAGGSRRGGCSLVARRCSLLGGAAQEPS